MRIQTENGSSLRTWGQWKRIAEKMQQQANEVEIEQRKITTRITGNVVGGSLDGERMPEGTRDGQRYRWDRPAATLGLRQMNAPHQRARGENYA